LRDLILEHARINDNIIKRLASNDKILEDINDKLDYFSSARLAQIACHTHLKTKWNACPYVCLEINHT
jgi:hypothetical protein